jgi:hypothetical protein
VEGVALVCILAGLELREESMPYIYKLMILPVACLGFDFEEM